MIANAVDVAALAVGADVAIEVALIGIAAGDVAAVGIAAVGVIAVGIVAAPRGVRRRGRLEGQLKHSMIGARRWLVNALDSEPMQAAASLFGRIRRAAKLRHRASTTPVSRTAHQTLQVVRVARRLPALACSGLDVSTMLRS
jgi:hypothetical protein